MIGRLNASQKPTNRAPFWDEGMSSVPAIASGWFATMPTGWPAIVAKPGDEVRSPPSPQLEEIAVVDDRLDHRPHVVAARRRIGEQVARLGSEAVGGIVGRPARRCLVGVRGEVREQQLDHRLGCVDVVDDDRRGAGVPCVHVRAAELVRVDAHAGELGDHRRAAHERVRVGGHDHEVGEAEQERRPGDCGPGHREHHRHDARAVGERPRGEAPAVEGRHAFDDVGAARSDVADERDPLCERDVRGDRDGLAVVGAERSLAIGGIDLDDDRRPAADVVDARGDTASGSGPDRDAHGPKLRPFRSAWCGEGQVQARLVRRLGPHDPSHDIGDSLRLGREHAAAPIGEADAAASETPTGSRFHVPVRYAGTAVAGSTAAPNPWNASDAARRTPSSSAWACSLTPARAACTSSSSRSAVPGALSSRG